MPNYDKYEPHVGGFRARLNAALPITDGGFFGAVSLNTTGKVIVGTAGQTGLVGLVVKNVARGPVGPWGTDLHGGTPNAYAPVGAMAGDVVDVMTNGDIVDLNTTNFPAGTKVYAKPDGTLSTVGTGGGILIGWTVEAGRLIVRIGTAVTTSVV